jgi:uncharacterized protein (UPF0147 family)
MTDYKELLDELRSKWLFPRNIEAADLIERLIRERDEALAREKEAIAELDRITQRCNMIIGKVDEARAKAIDEAAAVVTEHYQSLCQEHRLLLVNRANAILALKDKPNE